jgi:hypothetical protein
MNIYQLEEEIKVVRFRISNAKSIKVKNDLGKYLKRLIKERNDYYRFRR